MTEVGVMIDLVVEEADLREGKAQDCGECPVALATARALKAEGIGLIPHVMWTSIWLLEPDDPKVMVAEAEMPQEIMRFVEAFDMVGHCEECQPPELPGPAALLFRAPPESVPAGFRRRKVTI